MPKLIRIDDENLLDMAQRGMTQKEMASELEISIPTLAKRLADLKDKQGILLKYRELQALHLTSIQARILEAITPEKIEEASLKDLITSFKILKDKELTLDGKPSEIKGLVGYLIELEKEEALGSAIEGEVVPMLSDMEDKPKGTGDISDEDYIPDL